MKRFLLSKTGIITLCIVTVFMAFMLHRVTGRARARETELRNQPLNMTSTTGMAKIQSQQTWEKGLSKAPGAQNRGELEDEKAQMTETKNVQKPEPKNTSAATGALQQNLSYLDQSRALGGKSKKDKDRQGRSQIRRKTAGGVGEAQNVEGETGVIKKKTSVHLRLEGRGPGDKKARVAAGVKGSQEDTAEEQGSTPRVAAGIQEAQNNPGDSSETEAKANRSVALDTPVNGEHRRPGASVEQSGSGGTNSAAWLVNAASAEAQGSFCPYGRPIRCELVFTIDSCMEETPLVALVVEPVYNNGQLVIPAGAELHGMARPDRLRDRIFSANEWVLLFPREGDLANGREMRVRGLALDRAEPAADGLSWGITDGSNGLQGQIIRTLENEEIKRFAATFISASALGLQEREGSGRDGSRYKNSPTNAALQGVAATLEDAARKIGAEIERHGVFLRVPGGKQFYFYPQQAIHPRMAMLPKPTGRPAER